MVHHQPPADIACSFQCDRAKDAPDMKTKRFLYIVSEFHASASIRHRDFLYLVGAEKHPLYGIAFVLACLVRQFANIYQS